MTKPSGQSFAATLQHAGTEKVTEGQRSRHTSTGASMPREHAKELSCACQCCSDSAACWDLVCIRRHRQDMPPQGFGKRFQDVKSTKDKQGPQRAIARACLHRGIHSQGACEGAEDGRAGPCHRRDQAQNARRTSLLGVHHLARTEASVLQACLLVSSSTPPVGAEPLVRWQLLPPARASAPAGLPAEVWGCWQAGTRGWQASEDNPPTPHTYGAQEVQPVHAFLVHASHVSDQRLSLATRSGLSEPATPYTLHPSLAAKAASSGHKTSTAIISLQPSPQCPAPWQYPAVPHWAAHPP